MRLAIIESDPRGGLLHYAAQLSEALAERGHEVDFITARGHELEGPLGAARTRGVLPAALHTPTEPPTGLSYLLRRAGIATRVVAASLRTLWEVARGGYDAVLLVDDLSVAPAAAGAFLLTLMPGGPRIAAICHEPRPRSRHGQDVYEQSHSLLAILRRLYPRLDVVFVHGEQSRKQFLDFWPPTRLAVIPHGDERILVGDPPPPSEEERILFFGEWRRAKGIRDLMAAFDQLVERRPQARLTIAGVPTPDAEPDEIRAWAARHDGKVALVDQYVPIADVREVFASARLVAAPYIAGSQSGVVHLAMTMERAVVASDIGELPATVLDGVTGRIVPSGDVAALCDALGELLADPELARQWGSAGRARVLSEFGWERVAERVEAGLRT
jgi:glycosyltransferase involved in cell wall biosynthesis